MNTCTRSVSIMSPFSILSGSWSCMSMDLTVRYKCDHVILYDTTSGHAWLDIIIITIISKVQIVKKLSALYKEYDGSWLMYMYVKKSNKKAKIKHIPHGVTLTHPLSLYTHPHPPTHPHTHTMHISNRTGLSSSEWYRLKKCVFREDLKVVIAAAFLMCDGSEFQTEGPKWEKAQSPFVLYLYSETFRWLKRGSFPFQCRPLMIFIGSALTSKTLSC